MERKKYLIKFGDGSQILTSSFLEWCIFSPTGYVDKKLEDRIFKWCIIGFIVFIVVSLICVYITQGKI